MILAERASRLAAEAQVSGARLEIERLKLLLAKARREQFGQSSERGARIVAQLELQLSELEETEAETEVAAEITASAADRPFRGEGTRRPARRPLPEHLPRERILYAAPCACPRCGGPVRKLGEDVTETLECVPRRWKVVVHVREKVSCRRCETVNQPPAPSHPIARGRAGPHLLALVLAAKYGQHLPLTRQSAIYAGEGVGIDVSTLADWVGAAAASLMPLVEAIRTHVFAAERIHADDTTVPVLAKERTRTGRLWAYVRDDRPFAGPAPPAAAFFYSPDRQGQHPERHLAGFAGIMQADAYAGFNRLYEPGRQPGPILEAACWAHARRKLFELAAVAKAPIASEAVQRIDRLFAIERDITGLPAEARLAARAEFSAPILAELEPWLRQQQERLSRRSEVGKAIAYTTKRWATLTRFMNDGRICLTNNAAERALRGVAVGRHNWTFAGSDRGGERAAAIYTLIETAKLNCVDPQAWLADVLARLPDHPARSIDQLLPWRWNGATTIRTAD
ncbi:MAG: IS66 family transposase [Geminicoccaceae bacterium]